MRTALSRLLADALVSKLVSICFGFAASLLLTSRLLVAHRSPDKS